MQEEVKANQNSKMSLNFTKQGEFKIEVEGALTPEVLAQIEQLQNQASYYRQKEHELEKEKAKSQSNIDGTVVAFLGGMFILLIYLSSTAVSFGVAQLKTNQEVQNVQFIRK